MIKTINTGVAELLCVKVPEDARSFKVFNDEMPYLYFYSGHADTHRCYLSIGNYELLGIAHELTEDVWDSVMESDLHLRLRCSFILTIRIRVQISVL